jgi:hypothetical protein
MYKRISQSVLIAALVGFIINPVFGFAATDNSNETLSQRLDSAELMLTEMRDVLSVGAVLGDRNENNSKKEVRAILDTVDKVDLRLELLSLKLQLQKLIGSFTSQPVDLTSLEPGAQRLQQMGSKIDNSVQDLSVKSPGEAVAASNLAESGSELVQNITNHQPGDSTSGIAENLETIRSSVTLLQDELADQLDDTTPVEPNNEIEVREGETNPDGSTLVVEPDSTSDTYGVVSFQIEPEDQLDIESIPIEFHNDSSREFSEIVSEAFLEVDGEELQTFEVSDEVERSQELADGYAHRLNFNTQNDLQIRAGDNRELTLFVKLEQASNYQKGTRILPLMTDELAADITVSDNGDNRSIQSVNNFDNIGSIHSLRKNGVHADPDNVSSKADFTEEGTRSHGTFKVEYEVTAFAEDQLWATHDYTLVDDDGNRYDPAEFDDKPNQSVSCQTESQAERWKGGSYIIREGETEEFTLTCEVTVSEDGFYRLRMDEIKYDEFEDNTPVDTLQLTPKKAWQTDLINIKAADDTNGSSADPKALFQQDAVDSDQKVQVKYNPGVKEKDTPNWAYYYTVEFRCDNDVINPRAKVWGSFDCNEETRHETNGGVSDRTLPTYFKSSSDQKETVDLIVKVYDNSTDKQLGKATDSIFVEPEEEEFDGLDLSLSPNRDGDQVGVSGEWNEHPEATGYRKIVHRQDIYGEATVSSMIKNDPTKLSTGLYTNKAEDEGYCYYFEVTVEPLKDGELIDGAEDTEELCVVANEENKPGKHPDEFKFGDYTQDGEISNIDIGLTESYAEGRIFGVTETTKYAVDVNKSGEVTAADSHLIEAYVEGRLDKLPVENARFGDVNRDGEVSQSDLTMIDEYLSGSQDLDGVQKVLADVLGDESVNEDDRNLIKKYIDGEIDSLNI